MFLSETERINYYKIFEKFVVVINTLKKQKSYIQKLINLMIA